MAFVTHRIYADREQWFYITDKHEMMTSRRQLDEWFERLSDPDYSSQEETSGLFGGDD